MHNIVLCVDLGGTHCSSALIDKGSDCVIETTYFRGHVDSNDTRSKILKQIQQIIDKTLMSSKEVPTEMKVSCPGPFDYQNGIPLMDKMNKYQDLLNFNLKEYFSEITNIKPSWIQFNNDATAFLLGEVFCRGIQRGRVVGLTLGTGLGSSLFDNGEIEDLNFGSAAYVNGIVEDVISTRGILKHLQDRFGSVPVQNIKDLVESESLNDERTEAFDYLARNLSTFIRQYVAPLAPDLIVIGGSIAKAHTYFFDSLNLPADLKIERASSDERNLFLGLTSETYSI
ncbi:ROK family protein [Sphingobacterium sp. JB170]|uniref:ROK family protein n=1 Tax=Sphingobacterium sp. JB170 TaxID=1434842 RepID=UPI00097EB81E|nr:ROK family protein [Sphingobacterium sp. JB170]SJN46556.1 putative glucokinase [Sphingobacterium sp. JB170]